MFLGHLLCSVLVLVSHRGSSKVSSAKICRPDSTRLLTPVCVVVEKIYRSCDTEENMQECVGNEACVC